MWSGTRRKPLTMYLGVRVGGSDQKKKKEYFKIMKMNENKA